MYSQKTKQQIYRFRMVFIPGVVEHVVFDAVQKIMHYSWMESYAPDKERSNGLHVNNIDNCI